MRVIIETQSNPLFRGQESEQVFDQRGGLCQVGQGHIVVTTNQIDPEYQRYWQGLGFTMPTLIQAGPFDPSYTLSELIANKPDVQEEILSSVNGTPARIEPFWVTECDLVLPDILGIPFYCNPDVFIEYACKFRFKKFCDEVGLATAPWVGGYTIDEIVGAYQRSEFASSPALVKAANSTGGLDLGTMIQVNSAAELASQPEKLNGLLAPLIVEQSVDIWAEVTIHWEIGEDGVYRIIGIFDQFAKNSSYAGASLPTTLSKYLQKSIKRELVTRFIPPLQELRATGFFCCDLLVMEDGTVLWTDFNPRKGAILYIHDMVERLGQVMNWESGTMPNVWHEHVNLETGRSFSDVKQRLGALLAPSNNEPFVIVTNPGTLPYGGVDLTGLSFDGLEHAQAIVARAKVCLAS